MHLMLIPQLLTTPHLSNLMLSSSPYELQPRFPVNVIERLSRRHLIDVCFRM
ncbi:thermoresistant gluconokinase [Moniliophthora roreri]|nr:thermoresistant gluconokinase [Moniliophthora roreri]